MEAAPQNQSSGPGIKVLALAVVALLAVAAFVSRAGGGPERVSWSTDFDQALAAAARDGKPVLVDFSANWCGSCAHMKRHVFSDTQVAAAIERSYQPVRVDLTAPGAAQEQLAIQYAVEAIPTMLILGPDGSERGRAGYLSAPEFLAWLDRDGLATDGQIVSP